MFPEQTSGADELTDDELERWIATFPVQGLNAPKGTR
jgi:hypothetical protein